MDPTPGSSHGCPLQAGSWAARGPQRSPTRRRLPRQAVRTFCHSDRKTGHQGFVTSSLHLCLCPNSFPLLHGPVHPSHLHRSDLYRMFMSCAAHSWEYSPHSPHRSGPGCVSPATQRNDSFLAAWYLFTHHCLLFWLG